MVLSLGIMFHHPHKLTSMEKTRKWRINWLFQPDLFQNFHSKERFSQSLPWLQISRTVKPSSLWELSAEEILQRFSHFTQFSSSFICLIFNFKCHRTQCGTKIFKTDRARVICMDFIPWNNFQWLLNVTVLCKP